jgi:hypothetical protein
MSAPNFEHYVNEKTKGSEFEFVLRKAKMKDPEAVGLLKSKNFQQRMFTHVSKRSRSPEQTIKALLMKVGVAVSIILFEKLLGRLLKPTAAKVR